MTEISESSISAKSLNYSKKLFDGPSYLWQPIKQVGGTTALTIPASNVQDSVYELPANKVFNLSRSILEATATPAAGAAFNYLYMNSWSMVSQIILASGSGQQLLDLSNVQNYTNIVRGAEMTIDEFCAKDDQEQFSKSNALAANNKRHDNSACDISYLEPRYYDLKVADGKTNGGSATATPVRPFKYPFCDLKNTVLAMDKDLLFPEVMYLTIKFGPTSKMGMNSTNDNDLNTGAAALGTVALTSLQLHLAVETNPNITEALRAKVASGTFSCLFPYVVSYRHQQTAAGTQTCTVRLVKGSARAIKKIYHSVYNATESKDTSYDHSNLAGAKIESYHTEMDSQRLQPVEIDCKTQFWDWMIHKGLLKSTPYGLSRNVYQYNWFHCDNFSGESKVDEELPVPKENVISGLDLTQDRIWTFNTTNAAGANVQYSYVVLQKTLYITGANDSVVANREVRVGI